MSLYISLFLASLFCGLGQSRRPPKGKTKTGLAWSFLLVIFSFAIGLRHQVGGDWFNYQIVRETWASYDDPWSVLQERTDPAYALLCWLSPGIGGDYFVNFICGICFSTSLFYFCKKQVNPWLALVISIPYLVTVVGMGYTRQAVAIGFVMRGLVALGEDKNLRFIFWVFVAALFHKSAAILVPLGLFSGSASGFLGRGCVVIFFPLLFFLLLSESLDVLYVNYIDSQMESAGAAIRISMNALPAVLFLLRRKEFQLIGVEYKFWSMMSFVAIIFVPLLIVSPSSTAVDRVALYWIPIQIFVLSRVPEALSTGIKSYNLIFWSVVIYSLSVLLIWLFFAIHASAWVPYRFYPWELLMQALGDL